jgi:hypothetical protein
VVYQDDIRLILMSDSRRYRSILPIGKATSVANKY